MILAQVIKRVFRFKNGDISGSCVVIDVDNRQYICTAKHCFPSSGDFIEIFHDNQWKPSKVRLVGYGSHDSDISVLASDIQLVPNNLPLSANCGELSYGQEVFFLGFPYGMHMDSMELNNQYPFPFVKRFTLSAFSTSKNGKNEFFLDGHNNPGFSGGPVVFSPRGHQKGEWRIFAIVSGYRHQNVPVLNKDGKETGDIVHANTGITHAYGINHAVDVIHSNPIGLPLK